MFSFLILKRLQHNTNRNVEDKQFNASYKTRREGDKIFCEYLIIFYGKLIN
ncbi:MAG: hypothetical protein LBH59_07710 [Planctomycetaceae bacterium]|nr:hypothetical protein [Planctomycetaceae bacterium]